MDLRVQPHSPVTCQENYTKLITPFAINLYIINIGLAVLHQLAKSDVINPALALKNRDL